MVVPDPLSRIYEDSQVGSAKQKERVEKWKRVRWGKHVIEQDGINYWRFDNGEIRMIPEVKIRDELVDRIHGKLLHRGVESVYYNLKLKYYWPGMKEFIREKLKKCEICEVNNRKNKMGYEFVATSRKMESLRLI